MNEKELEFRLNNISSLQKKLTNTVDRSQKLLTKFTNDFNKDNLTLAWSALEMITDVLESIQTELVKFNHV